MKRVLVLLALVAALFVAGACTYDTNISVDASAKLLYIHKSPVSIAASTFSGFHRNSLSDDDLEYIFRNLIEREDPSFESAFLYLEVYDEISDQYLRSEEYGVTFESSTNHFVFADMNARY